MALPPSLEPKSIERDWSGDVGMRWVAQARVKGGQCWVTWAAVWGLAPHFVRWFSGVKTGSVRANECVARVARGDTRP